MGGRLAFGYIARAVHADEEKRHARCIGPLHGAQAVANGFEADAKPLSQQVDVILQLLGSSQELSVGQDQNCRV